MHGNMNVKAGENSGNSHELMNKNSPPPPPHP